MSVLDIYRKTPQDIIKPNLEELVMLLVSSGLVKAGQTKHIEEHSTVVLFVVRMGDMCYKDESRFPTGPWCKEGDFILTRAYAGTRFKIHGREFRIINDDTVEGVVQDPRGYTRA